MTTRSRKSLLLGTALAAVGLVLGAGGAAAQKKGGTLIYANVSAVFTMDPHVAANVVDAEAIHQIHEALVEMGGTYNATPMLASKVEISPDAQHFTFTLRHGVKFQNGKEMTSADVLATMQRYKRVSPNAALFADVSTFETPDPYTFVINLNHPNALLVEAMKTPTYPLSIIPAEEKDKPARVVDNIGTGPYEIADWVKDDHLTLRRFEGYTPDETAKGPDGYAGRKTAYLDTVRYNFVPEANARIAALQAGDADFIAQVPADQIKRVQAQPGLSVLTVTPFCQREFVLDSQNPPTDNVLIRQAISAVVNVDDMMAASGQISARNPSLMFATSPYYPGDAVAEWYDTKNPDKAKALLKQAGYSGQKIVLETNANYAYMQNAILVLVEEMKAVGMNAEVKMTDWTTNANDMVKGTGGWNVSTTGFCSGPLLGPQQWRPLLIGFPQIKNDSILDNTYNDLFSSADLSKRKADWLTIEQRILGQAYMIKVDDIADVRAYNSNKFANMTPYYTQRFWDVWQK
jgi:peptide/nickel transport system substrate-binding protein